MNSSVKRGNFMELLTCTIILIMTSDTANDYAKCKMQNDYAKWQITINCWVQFPKIPTSLSL